MVENNKRITFLQYLNTVILTVIGIFAAIAVITLDKIRDNQSDFTTRLVKVETIQPLNTTFITDVSKRVSILETNYFDLVKTWVDANYVRKPQK